jgi:hypothetical protein
VSKLSRLPSLPSVDVHGLPVSCKHLCCAVDNTADTKLSMQVLSPFLVSAYLSALVFFQSLHLSTASVVFELTSFPYSLALTGRFCLYTDEPFCLATHSSLTGEAQMIHSLMTHRPPALPLILHWEAVEHSMTHAPLPCHSFIFTVGGSEAIH